MTCKFITKIKYFVVLTLTIFTLCDSVPLSSVNVSRDTENGSPTLSNQTSANSSVAGTNPGFIGHRLLRIQAKPRNGYLPTNGTLMIIGDSTMRIFDFNEIMHPKFDPSSFLKQATAESTQKIEVPFNYGQHYFVFLPPALMKEYRLMRSRRRRRFKRHHPSILKNILGALQDYALVPIQSNTGQVRYILLKNPKFVISGVGPSGTPITASIPVTQQPGSLSLVQPGSSSQSQSQDHHSQSQPHHTQTNPKLPAVKSVPSPSQRVLPQIMDIMSPMTIAPPQRRAPPAPRSWVPSRSRTQPLTRNNRPLSASKPKTAVLGDRSDRLERPIPAAGPIDSLFNDNMVTRPAVQMRHVHSHSRGHIQSQSLNPAPNVLPRVDMVSHNIQSTGQSSSISSSIGSSSSANGANGISSVDTALGSVASGTVDNTAPIDGSGTHTVHQTEIVETVIETKNQEAAVAKTDTAAVAANETSSVSTKGGDSAGVASKTSASSAASASSAVAAKQEKVISSKKTIKTTKIKQGTDAQGKPASVHEVTEVVEHTSAAKTGAATATKTDAAAATSSGSAAVVSKGSNSGSASADSASAAAASSSASVTSNNATATTVKKKTIKKTVVTKTAAAPAAASVPTIDAAAATITDTSNTLVADGLAVTAVDSGMPPTKRRRKNKKKAKTAILSENNDKQSVGFKAALIPTARPKIAAKIMDKTTQSPQSTPMTTVTETAGEEQMTTVSPTTEEVELEDILTTTMNPSAIQYGYPITVTTVLPQVAGWAGGPTTEPALGPLDRINTTDVPEEIEARPDKTPAELRREMAKLNPNLPKNSPALKSQRTSGAQAKPGQGAGGKRGRRPQGKRPPRKQNAGRRRKTQGRRRNRNSRNNPK